MESGSGDFQHSSMDSAVRKAKNRSLLGFDEAANREWTDNFFFVQAADTQLGFMSVYGDGVKDKKQYPDVTWDQEMELCRQSVQLMNRMTPRPAFFIVCGDLVDAFPAEWPEIRKQQEKDLLNVYSHLHKDIPMVCVCGNHDVGNQPTPETVAGYVDTFGDDYFSFWFSGVKFIVLNSQYYFDSSLTASLAQEQDIWLQQELSKPAIHSVIFQHIPWFVTQPEEENNYFNIQLELRKKMLNSFYEAGVKKIFCGHCHRNAGGWFKDMELVVTSAIGCQLGPDQHGFRLVKVKKSAIDHEYHPLSSCPTNITFSEA